MTDADRNLLLAEILKEAREGKRHAALRTVQSLAFARIIRFTKSLLADAETPKV